MTYGIIGVGAIAAAIVTGLCEHAPDAPAVVLSPRNAGRAADLASRFPTVRVAQSNQEVIDGSSVLLLCLRPQEARSVLPGLNFRGDQAIVSMMAGISIEALRALVAPAQNIARAIPLPAVASREGATPIYPPTEAATALFARLGQPIEIPHEPASKRPRPPRQRSQRILPTWTRSAAGSLRRALRSRRHAVRSPPPSQGWRHSCAIKSRTSASLRATMRREAEPMSNSWACWNRRACSTPSTSD